MKLKDWQQYNTASKCWICKENLEQAKFNKLQAFSLNTGKYIGTVHHEYYSKQNKIIGPEYDKLLSTDPKIEFDRDNECCYCEKPLFNAERIKFVIMII